MQTARSGVTLTVFKGWIYAIGKLNNWFFIILILTLTAKNPNIFNFQVDLMVLQDFQHQKNIIHQNLQNGLQLQIWVHHVVISLQLH